MRRLRIALSTALLALSVAAPIARADDLVLLNGRIVTLDAASSIAEAIAISGSRITAVGTRAEVEAVAPANAQRIDLGGRTVIPGLIDSHIHAIRAGQRAATEVSFVGATSVKEALERLAAAAARAPMGQWLIVGGGWTAAQFEERRRPTLDEIATAAPRHPVYIQLFYRAVLMNDLARDGLSLLTDADLSSAGFKRDDREAGWISGESPAVTALFDRLAVPTLEDAKRGTRSFFADLNRYGITGVIDPGGHNLAWRDYAAVQALWAESALTLRVVYSLSAPNAGSAPADFNSARLRRGSERGESMLRFNGIGERVTWGLFNNDNPSQAQKEEFLATARWAAQRRLSLTVHWNNDRSVHHALDIFAVVDAERPIRDLRWSIAHLHDASPDTLRRMKALGVGWLMQNGLYFAAPQFLIARGNRINAIPPIRSAIEMGLPVGGGTDANRVMGHNPFVSLRWMVDGKTVEGVPTRAASELVDREQALRLYTQGSAWFAFDETERGTLEPGKLADLAVLDADYFGVPLEDVSRIRSVLTIVGGRIVHGSAPLAEGGRNLYPGASEFPR